MRKLILLVVMVLCIGGYAFAENIVSINQYSVNIKNDSGDHLVTTIPVTTIRPDVDKLIGYSCVPLTTGNSETYVTVYDGTDKSLSGECLGESEVLYGGIYENFEFWPKKISEGVVVDQGAYTDVQIYFIRQ